MKLLIYLGLLIFILFSPVAAQVTQKPAAEAILRLEVEGAKGLELKKADTTKLLRIEVRGKDHDGKESVYSGFELREILKIAGVKFGKELRGANLALFLMAEAADGYRAVFALPELDAEFTDKKIILADMQEGKPLSEKNGPWQIIVPDEKRHARWVRQVIALKVKAAK